MLLEFKMKNFKSFKTEMSFKMYPAPIKDLEYSLIIKKNGRKDIKALSCAVIYGPNSAGKTNIVGGMEVFRSIVLNGNIMNKDNVSSPNTAVKNLELIPNIDSHEKDPVVFYIKFMSQSLIIEYTISLELGTFLDSYYNRKIIEEKLYINKNLIYERNDKLKIGKLEVIKDYLIENFSGDTAENIAKANLDPKELFLNGIFKTLYSKKIFEIIYEWFSEKFKIIYHADKLYVSPMIESDDREKKYYIDKTLNKALEDFGLTSEKIAYPINREKEKIIPLSMLNLDNNTIVLPAEVFESFGTIRFLNIFPLIFMAIKNGATLVIDELDASIHPMAIMNIINIFHNDEININGAQLIFNTHNPIFLNNSLLRRDEIKFVEKEAEGSVQYSLSDFKTNGENGVRNTEDYMKNYFVNKYGAIKNIDFSNVFDNMKGNRK